MEGSKNGGVGKQTPGKDTKPDASIYKDKSDLREYAQVVIQRDKSVADAFSTAVVGAVISGVLLPKACEASASITEVASGAGITLRHTRISQRCEMTKRGWCAAQQGNTPITARKALLDSDSVLRTIL